MLLRMLLNINRFGFLNLSSLPFSYRSAIGSVHAVNVIEYQLQALCQKFATGRCETGLFLVIGNF